MLNQFNVMGRLCARPELRYTQSGLPVVNCRLAVDRNYLTIGQRETDFLSVVSWRGTAVVLPGRGYFKMEKLQQAICEILDGQMGYTRQKDGTYCFEIYADYRARLTAEDGPYPDGLSDEDDEMLHDVLLDLVCYAPRLTTT